jgi:hypothetical protein
MPDRSPYTVKTLLCYLAELERRAKRIEELTAADPDFDPSELKDDPIFQIERELRESRRTLRAWPDVQRFVRDCEADGFTFDAGVNQWVASACKAHAKLPDEVGEFNLDEFCDLGDTVTQIPPGQLRGTDSGSRQRLTVNLPRKIATLDDVEYDVASDSALRWLQVLADQPGEWIAGRDLKNYDPYLEGARTNRLRQYLPDAVRALIESDTGKGSRIKLA